RRSVVHLTRSAIVIPSEAGMCFFLTSAGRGDRESGGSRRTLKLVVLGEIEVEGYIHGLASPVGGQGRHLVDAGEGANAGVVHGTIAAGLRETNIFEGAVAENGESDDGVSRARGADRSVDGVLHPVILHAFGDAGDIPRIARGKFSAALTAHGDPRGVRHGAGFGTVARGNVHGAALPVGDSVCGRRSFVLESFGGLAGRRRRLEFVKLGDFRGVGLEFR